jgi:predicted dehydrogenase
MDTDSNIQIKHLGSATTDVSYERENRNFAGDCVYFLQQHFLESLRSGRAFESNGADYLETIRVVEAVYESAAIGSVVTLRPA